MQRLYCVLYSSLFASSLISAKDTFIPFQVPPLPYDYNSLEPFIDTKTMELHHNKHHEKYVADLNAAISKHPELYGKGVVELVQQWPTLTEDIRNEIRNNAGGHLNHSLFWKWMSPCKTKPSNQFLKELKKHFGTFDEFKKKFSDAAKKVFGSGWVWLCLDDKKNLNIVTTPNQDNPITNGLNPILGLDVWEHAYYLKYTNKRLDYLENWWNIVNWPEVERLHREIQSKAH